MNSKQLEVKTKTLWQLLDGGVSSLHTVAVCLRYFYFEKSTNIHKETSTLQVSKPPILEY